MAAEENMDIVTQCVEELTTKKGRLPTFKQLAEATGFPEEECKEFMIGYRQMVKEKRKKQKVAPKEKAASAAPSEFCVAHKRVSMVSQMWRSSRSRRSLQPKRLSILMLKRPCQMDRAPSLMDRAASLRCRSLSRPSLLKSQTTNLVCLMDHRS